MSPHRSPSENDFDASIDSRINIRYHLRSRKVERDEGFEGIRRGFGNGFN